MKNYEKEERSILSEIAENDNVSVAIPVYKSALDDPLINAIQAEQYIPNFLNAIAGEHANDEILSFTYGPKRIYVIFVSPDAGESSWQFAAMYTRNLVSRMIDDGCRDIAISSIGISEFGYDEDLAMKAQENVIKKFAKKNDKITFYFDTIPEDLKPQKGKHLGDGHQGEVLLEDASHEPAHTHMKVLMPLGLIDSYRRYFDEYIRQRALQKENIRERDGETIDSLAALGKAMQFYEGGKKPMNFYKWSCRRVSKREGQGFYSPTPSKQKLKLMILLLDMDVEEAEACLNFCGYGFARFNREDQALKYILSHWPHPINVLEADAMLRKRFGKEAAIIDKGKKRKKK